MITTKHGNKYTEHEWAEMMKNWADEAKEAHDYLDAISAIEKAGAQMLIEKAGVEGAKARMVARHIFKNGCEGIQFTSAEKKVTVKQISNWMIAQERMVR